MMESRVKGMAPEDSDTDAIIIADFLCKVPFFNRAALVTERRPARHPGSFPVPYPMVAG